MQANQLKKGLLFSVYILIIELFFGLADFYQQTPLLNFYLGSFASIVILYFLSRMIVVKLVEYDVVQDILPFITSSILSGILIWLIFNGEGSILGISILSFFVPTIIPITQILFKDLLLEKQVTTSTLSSIPVNPEKQQHEESVQHFSASSETIQSNSTPIKEEPKAIDFILENENGKILLKVPLESILCFEANDNYVVTYYLGNNNQVKKSMERFSLKKIEEILENIKAPNFLRVHKSYLVHKIYVEEIKGKSQAHKLKMEHLDIMVPVSRSFQISIIRGY